MIRRPGQWHHAGTGSKEAYAAVKAAKYANQDNFIPSSWRQVDASTARDLLDTLTTPEPGDIRTGTLWHPTPVIRQRTKWAAGQQHAY